MQPDPISDVIDEQLIINATTIEQLHLFRDRTKLDHLPGVDTAEERARLSAVLNDLAGRLALGVADHPTKLWVMTEFQRSLELVAGEDTEAREHVGMELEELMDVLGIDSSDGLLAYYLGGI